MGTVMMTMSACFAAVVMSAHFPTTPPLPLPQARNHGGRGFYVCGVFFGPQDAAAGADRLESLVGRNGASGESREGNRIKDGEEFWEDETSWKKSDRGR